MRLAEDEILVIEGIHCLNDKLTSQIEKDKKYKIYISALTVLNMDRYNRISTTDTRLIRRIVRDYQFRSYSAIHTLNTSSIRTRQFIIKRIYWRRNIRVTLILLKILLNIKIKCKTRNQNGKC